MLFEKTKVSPSSIPVEGKGWKSKAEPHLGKLTRGKIMVSFNFMPTLSVSVPIPMAVY